MKSLVHIFSNVKPHPVGDGFVVRSLFSPQSAGSAISPFLLFDYGEPTRIAPTKEARGVGAHPHKGFETVTIVFQGEIEHRDSTGSAGKIGPGDVQWMTAASGIVHEEIIGREFREQGGTLEFIQLWVNLPAKDKTASPGYQTLLATDIPTIALPDNAGTARIIAGELFGTRGPARTFTPIHVWDVHLAAGQTVELPVQEGHMAGVFVRRGTLSIEENELGATDFALFDTKDTGISLSAATDTDLVVLSGEPINEPVATYGPFVMNTKAEILRAIDDYQGGRMGRLE
jgi:quercetin 2,3-dioxygenase